MTPDDKPKTLEQAKTVVLNEPRWHEWLPSKPRRFNTKRLAHKLVAALWYVGQEPLGPSPFKGKIKTINPTKG